MERPPPLVRKVEEALRRLGGGGLVVAVSGGPDSVALLLALHEARGTRPLTVAHLNHQLRGAEGDADEAFVRDLCAGLSLDCRCERLDVRRAAEAEGDNLEGVARRLRYDWLAHVAGEVGASWVATGHTANDQAETVLHHLLRGAGLRGLRGIAVCRPLSDRVRLIRPLLTATREEVMSYLNAIGQAHREDSTNRDPTLTRNRIRHQLLPLLAAEFNPQIVAVLSRLASQADEVYGAEEEQARALLAAAELPRAGALVVLDGERLAAAARSRLREAMRLLWEREGWPVEGMGFDAWERVASVALGELTAADLPGGVHARRRGRVVQVGARLGNPRMADAWRRADNAWMNPRIIRRALLSVSDKAGLIDLARGLAALGVELISTGGTRKALAGAGLAVRDISDVTGFPEILDGRVKTLHPKIHGGLLAVRDNPQHVQTIAAQGIQPIDLVVCNLYPFEQTVARPGATHEEVVENIDIGGPSMVRSAAKNYHDVAVVTSPEQYAAVLDELRANNGALTQATRERLAAAAFARTAAYDRAIAAYFAKKTDTDSFPGLLELRFEKKMPLRYGENPHQPAAFYVEPGVSHPCVSTAEPLHGKELSYNNILDLDSAFNLVREFADPAAVVIKHNNPCGAAVGAALEEAFRKAYEGDPLSAYGGVLAFNREVDEATATQITEPKRFIECVIAPGFSDAAFKLLTTRPTWKNSVRLLRTGPLKPDDAKARGLDLRRVDGGLLVQGRDLSGADDFANLKVATKRQPTAAELADLRFAWLVCKHVKSNAIVLAKGGMLVGVGAGQMSRVDSVHLAVRKSGGRHVGSVLASDAFFPFRDNVDEAAKAGVTAIVQPGGSMRDADSVAACDEHGLAMVFTGVRHFRH